MPSMFLSFQMIKILRMERLNVTASMPLRSLLVVVAMQFVQMLHERRMV
jgi:hypothetical protein